MPYLLDTNVFIEAKNRYYAFDICPGFWKWMDQVVTTGDVRSVVRVRDELIGGKDELAKWVKARHDAAWFLDVSDEETQARFAEIAHLVQGQDYTEPAKANFLAKADPWLIAKAQVISGRVVTHEVSSPDVRRKVPIPNVCEYFGIEVINTFDVLRASSVSFVLAG